MSIQIAATAKRPKLLPNFDKSSRIPMVIIKKYIKKVAMSVVPNFSSLRNLVKDRPMPNVVERMTTHKKLEVKASKPYTANAILWGANWEEMR